MVEAFVEATREMSAHDAAREIGLSHETVARWRRGQWKRLYPSTRRAIARYLEQRRHEDAAASGAESLLRSKAALYRTLTDMGGPGERADDKLFLVRLLQQVAEELRREGKRFPIQHLLDAEDEIRQGKL